MHTTHVLGSLLDAMEGFVREGDHKAVLVVAENAEVQTLTRCSLSHTHIHIHQVSLETLPTDALHPLVEVMQRAPAQLTLPNAAPLDGSLTQHLDGHGATNVPCVADRRDAAAALQTHSSVSLLVLPLCPTADVSILHHVAQEAEAASRTVTGLFVGSATPRAAARRRAQALQAEQAPPTCDDKCKAQVRALEAFILFVIIVMAISGGTLIMGAVDTPTRFAAPKKDHSAME